MWNEAVFPIVSTIFAFDRGHFLSAAAVFISILFFLVWFLVYLTKSRFVHHFFYIHSSHRFASVCVCACVRLVFFFSIRLCFRFDFAREHCNINTAQRTGVAVNGEKICLLTFVLCHNRILSKEEKNETTATSQQMKRKMRWAARGNERNGRNRAPEWWKRQGFCFQLPLDVNANANVSLTMRRVFSAAIVCGYVLQYRLSILLWSFFFCNVVVAFIFLLLLSTFHSDPFAQSLICNVLKARANPRRIEKIPMILSVRARVYFIHALPCYVPYICSFSRHLASFHSGSFIFFFFFSFHFVSH